MYSGPGDTQQSPLFLVLCAVCKYTGQFLKLGEQKAAFRLRQGQRSLLGASCLSHALHLSCTGVIGASLDVQGFLLQSPGCSGLRALTSVELLLEVPPELCRCPSPIYSFIHLILTRCRLSSAPLLPGGCVLQGPHLTEWQVHSSKG